MKNTMQVWLIQGKSPTGSELKFPVLTQECCFSEAAKNAQMQMEAQIEAAGLDEPADWELDSIHHLGEVIIPAANAEKLAACEATE